MVMVCVGSGSGQGDEGGDDKGDDGGLFEKHLEGVVE